MLIVLKFFVEGARGIESPPGFTDRDDGFEVRVAPSAIAPKLNPLFCINQGKGEVLWLFFWKGRRYLSLNLAYQTRVDPIDESSGIAKVFFHRSSSGYALIKEK